MELHEVIRSKLASFQSESLEPFASSLRKKLGDNCEAILAYGSTLSDVTRTKTSTPDFFVIVKSYLSFHSSWFHALLNWFLPPNVYHFVIDKKVSKYNVLSLRDFRRNTSRCAPDCYNLGRISKRMALVFSKENSISESIVKAQASAMRVMSRKTYYSMPKSFELSQFIEEVLRLSYRADVRVEASDKIDRIYSADEAYYREAYGLILKEMTHEPYFLLESNEGFTKKNRPIRDAWGKLRLQIFILKSKFRAQLRWPKGMITVEHWIDYLLAKIERTQGIKIELSERERRYWYIFAWKHFFELRRRDLIK